MRRQTRETYDYIVIGAGSAGAVVANTLSDREGDDALRGRDGPIGRP